MPLAMMEKCTLYRFQSNQYGTYGLFTFPDGETIVMGELPWRNNLPNVSCISKGEYVVRPHQSSTFGSCYIVDNVPNRSHILIHKANFCGDRNNKNLRTDLKGCLAPGLRIGNLTKANGRYQIAVLSSADALEKIFEKMGKEKFLLEISGVVG